MFKFKIKACDARREWIRSPEVLQNCSTGFHFPSQSEEIGQVLIICAYSFIKMKINFEFTNLLL